MDDGWQTSPRLPNGAAPMTPREPSRTSAPAGACRPVTSNYPQPYGKPAPT